MTSINFNVFGLTQPGFEPTGSRLQLMIFGFPDLPEWEAGALLIRSPRVVSENELHSSFSTYDHTVFTG